MSETIESLLPEGVGECQLSKVESLEAYFSQEFSPDGTCRPCQVQPLASLYLGVLERAGERQGAEALSTAYETGDTLTIARAMDNIKTGAKDGVRRVLEQLDCFAQSYEANGEEEAGAETV
ncbi:MAG: hypothetical protein Q8P59_09950 [Dehalococcoidia bacterium]|nr:hypothetical protein [Dehalococcoidia bacterium]